MIMMNDIFKSLLDYFRIVFTNDILVYSKSKKEYVGHRTILGILKEKQLYVKFSKFKLCSSSIDFLGHAVSKNGVMFYP